ncbi:MAG TPA: tRNA threonylcarbamoyladenosine dehydratase [Candidatus Egerieicola faecale]|uniref:tRNA threonylcarbamoyladenosine dehydratase n=1 Tax=Candidatus Egerieicola faecale TaxID=2840774 RepID=A0A9D1IQD2_9FIRM|nr:tRNA threonylcarbamoyladenosine dehydratase [Candidatus Egerieicola faecale]
MDTRTRMMLGNDGVDRLHHGTVAVFGVGGVGSFAVEALARAGVGKLLLCDSETVAPSNINRQLVAYQNTVGRLKVEVARERIASINPDCVVETFPFFFGEETLEQFPFACCDYVIDAIDSVPSKLLLIETCTRQNIPIISCMGAGNKLDPTRFRVGDIYQTSVCPLAKAIRTQCRKRGIRKLKVVWSEELPVHPPWVEGKPNPPGSVSFVPSVAGLILAGEVIKEISGVNLKKSPV